MEILDLLRMILITDECTKHLLCSECPLYKNGNCILIQILDYYNDDEKLLKFLHTQTNY